MKSSPNSITLAQPIANIILKTLLVIVFSCLFFGVSAQDTDSLSSVVLHKIRSEIFSQLNNQGVFDYQNKRFPSFKLKQLDGKIFDSETLIGKPTVINFWFTSCAPCLEEIPMLNKIQESYSQHVNFVAITYENTEKIAQFLDRKPFNFIQLVESSDFFKQLDVKTCPRMLITDENLVVRFIDRDKPKDLLEFEKELSRQINRILQH